MEEDKSESFRHYKFDGNEDKWHGWSSKALSLAKTKGFRNAYAIDTKPCSDNEYYKTTDKVMKSTYEANDRIFQFLMMSCSSIAFGLVNQAKTATLKDGDAYLA